MEKGKSGGSEISYKEVGGGNLTFQVVGKEQPGSSALPKFPGRGSREENLAPSKKANGATSFTLGLEGRGGGEEVTGPKVSKGGSRA